MSKILNHPFKKKKPNKHQHQDTKHMTRAKMNIQKSLAKYTNKEGFKQITYP